MCRFTRVSMLFWADPTYAYKPAGKLVSPRAPTFRLTGLLTLIMRTYMPFTAAAYADRSAVVVWACTYFWAFSLSVGSSVTSWTFFCLAK